MEEKHISKIAQELTLTEHQIQAVALLLEEGATIPFIARYRKEATGSLDEVAVTSIRDRLIQLKELDARKDAVLKSLEEHGHLTDELKEKVTAADTMAVLEDIYLPFKPKRRTRATIAKEKGLEPLALTIFEQTGTNPFEAAGAFVNHEKGVESSEDALSGARDIIAEMINENEQARLNYAVFLHPKESSNAVLLRVKKLRGLNTKIILNGKNLLHLRRLIGYWQ